MKLKEIFIFLGYILMDIYLKLYFYYSFLNSLKAPARSAERSVQPRAEQG